METVQSLPDFRRGQVWMVDFGDNTKGHEQRGERPAVIFGTNYNIRAVGLAMVIPGTTTTKIDPKTQRLLADVVEVNPSATNGLSRPTYFLCLQFRAVSITRFRRYLGQLTVSDMIKLSDIMKIFCNLD